MCNKLKTQLVLIALFIFSLLLFSCTNTVTGTLPAEEEFSSEVQDSSGNGAEEIAEENEIVQSGKEDIEGEAQEEETSQTTQVMDISPAEVFEILENDEDYLILDVRTEEEYVTGYLEGAILLPVQELEDRLDELPADKPIIVYCRSGSRSRRAAEILVANGFTMVYDMGGISDWIAEGYPVILEE
jgi:rhodanese-related sulfurtransferase